MVDVVILKLPQLLNYPEKSMIVDGLMMAEREVHHGSRKVAKIPKKSRSRAVRLGARSRDLLMTRSCCVKRRFSETRAFAPPGVSTLAIVARMWAKTTNKFSMVGD